ncbi:MAG: peptidoglycan-binding domain-containing protein [Candidatus Pacebacteria bacterium]|nr:peptidoglycan-binding domain-containing protein [Candidatus Paceibacterota bacterium]MDR3582891.1 peptidoglycan-binding domain-containing protein [Candidatus Paceibacterota bacterium]
MKNISNWIKVVAISLVVLFLSGCSAYIDGVSQPDTVAPGEHTTLSVNGHTNGGADDQNSPNTHKIYLAVLIPEDWAVTSITDSEEHFTMVSGSSQPDPASAPSGYVWFKWITDNAYGNNSDYDTFNIDVVVGQKAGTYTLKYYVGLATCDSDGNNCEDADTESNYSQDIVVTGGDNSNINSTENTTNQDSDSVNQKAKIDSWSAYQYTNANKASCPQRLKLIIDGRHFTNDTDVMIGGHDAASVTKNSSQKIVAKFCLAKLLNDQTDHIRTITVQNPDTGKDEADKQIDLDNVSLNLSADDFNTQTMEGIKNIQTVLGKLGLLDSQYITGNYGQITIDAITKFQANNGLPQTGTVGPLTKAELAEKIQ